LNIEYSYFENYLFNRKVGGDKWFLDPEFCEENFDAIDVVKNAGKVFQHIGNIAAKYTNDQVCDGLEYLITPFVSSACYAFFNDSIDFDLKVNTIRNMAKVFEDFFEHVCEKITCHNSRDSAPKSNHLCYMWWEIFPRHGIPAKASLNELDQEVLLILDRLLTLSNVACIESALHGLGHWYAGYPEKVEETIRTRFNDIPANLKGYAEQVMVGKVQ
jgi:hypothetical protein